MADNEPIEIRVTAEGVEQTAQKLNDLAKSAKGTGEAANKAGEMGKLGLWGLGEAAENAAQKMGVPNQVSRQLGNSVENLASKMGGLAIGFGAAGLAAMAVVGVWKALADRKRELAEATAREVSQLQGEVSQLYKNSAETEKVSKAKYELLVAKSALLRIDLAKQIIDETQKLAKQKDELASGGGLIDKFKQWFDTKSRFDAASGQWVSTQGEVVEGWKNEKSAVVGVTQAFLSLLKAQFESLNAPTPKFSDFMGGEKIEDELARLNDESSMAFQTKINNEMSMQGQYEIDRITSAWRISEEEQAAERAAQAERERVWEAAVTGAQVTTSTLSQFFQLMYQQGGNHARKYFTMYKIASMAETAITTAKSAMAALAPPPIGFGPIFGPAAAAAITALGALKIQLINRQKFDGGGDTGSGGGSYSPGSISYAPPSTNMPNYAGAWSGLNIYINGQPISVQELMMGMVKEVDRNNGSFGGFTVLAESMT